MSNQSINTSFQTMYNIVSWNVNGIRAINKSGKLEAFLKDTDPDVVCLQEIRCSDIHIEKEIKTKYPQYKHVSINCCQKRKGYAGVAVMSKYPFINDLSKSDVTAFQKDDGRLNIIEFNNCVLVNSYTPNSQGDTSPRFEYRINDWDSKFKQMIKNLQQKFPEKPVVICGDLNVAHEDIDVWNPSQMLHSPGFTKEERNNFTNLLSECNLVDSYRAIYPRDVSYTWWSNFHNARGQNKGMRIDYFLVPNDKRIKVDGVRIYKEYLGSDHAAMALVFSIIPL